MHRRLGLFNIYSYYSGYFIGKDVPQTPESSIVKQNLDAVAFVMVAKKIVCRYSKGVSCLSFLTGRMSLNTNLCNDF